MDEGGGCAAKHKSGVELRLGLDSGFQGRASCRRGKSAKDRRSEGVRGLQKRRRGRDLTGCFPAPTSALMFRLLERRVKAVVLVEMRVEEGVNFRGRPRLVRFKRR